VLPLLLLSLLGLVVAVACIVGSIRVAQRDPRLSLVLSATLFAFSCWIGIYSIRALNAHGDGFAVLGAFLVGSAAAVVTAFAVACALILFWGVLRSPLRRFAILAALPAVAVITHDHREEARARVAKAVEYVQQHRHEGEIRYREDCVRVPHDYQATCRDKLWPAPLPLIYTPDGKLDEAEIRTRDREVGATWARVNHATRISDCLRVWADYSESMDVMDGCKEYISGH
jgi:hypothetical protein